MTTREEYTQDYLYEAARFRGLAYFNARDFDYVRDGGDVRYYVDASVVLVLYIWPGRLGWPRHLPDSEAANADYVSNIGEPSAAEEIAEAALTGEFLFSDALHSRARRLRRAPVEETAGCARRFILEPHWIELLEALNKFNREGLGEGSSKEALIEKYEEATAQAKELHNKWSESRRRAVVQGAEQPSIDVEKRLSPVIDISAVFEGTEMLQRAMVRRFRFTRPVEPALRLPAQIQNIGENSAAIEPWKSALQDAGKASSAARKDAIAIAQIEALNRQPGQGEGGIIHCLVSGDKILHKAYFERKAYVYAQEQGITVGQIDLETGDFAKHYFLRHPGQFLPMLNQGDLPNQIDDMALFDEVVAAAEAALALIRCSERDALDLALQAIRSPKDVSFKLARSRNTRNDAVSNSQDLRALSNNLKEKWSHLRRTTVLVNRRLLSARAEIAQGLRAELRSKPDQESQELQQEQLETTLEIQRDTLFWAARRGLGTLSKQLRKKGAYKEDRNRLPLLVDLTELTVEPVFSAAQKLKLGNKRVIGSIDDRINRLAPEKTWQGLLLCASFACYADSWDEAAWFADRACDAIRAETAANEIRAQNKELAEATYILGYAYRMRMATGDYARAIEALGESERIGKIIGGRVGCLLQARALAESATVHLFEQARRRSSHERLLEISTLDAQRAVFLKALSHLEDLDAVDLDDRERRAKMFVLRQATLNLCIFDSLGHVLPNNSLSIPDRVTDAELAQEINAQRQAWQLAEDEAGVTVVDRNFLVLVEACLRGVPAAEVRRRWAELSDSRKREQLAKLDDQVAVEIDRCSRMLLEKYGTEA